MSDKWLVQRVVEFRGGTRVCVTVMVLDHESDAKWHAKQMAEQEGSIAESRLMDIEGKSAVDTGLSMADFMSKALGIVDVCFTVVSSPAPTRIIA